MKKDGLISVIIMSYVLTALLKKDVLSIVLALTASAITVIVSVCVMLVALTVTANLMTLERLHKNEHSANSLRNSRQDTDALSTGTGTTPAKNVPVLTRLKNLQIFLRRMFKPG